MAKVSSSSSSGFKSITVFDGLRLTTPAVVALIAYIILVAIVLMPFDMYTYDEEKQAYVKFNYSFGQRLLLVVLLIFPFLLGVYSVNCMMVGGCLIWSWIVALATILWSVVIVITTFSTKSFRLEDVVA
jgi:fumarate reductase subunit D